uniref:AlNc14C10G1249 protein n=1 Tax=Albugo laibachii Nc14 TaxID=890382 RepID=F0W2K2_9STRA|nr:AlNc14C10G1249 [Albugo laibachii Nc14]|eukprot:CCA15288.1 AlNc14C10G1249 [Albugo laibachii Nc14]
MQEIITLLLAITLTAISSSLRYKGIGLYEQESWRKILGVVLFLTGSIVEFITLSLINVALAIATNGLMFCVIEKRLLRDLNKNLTRAIGCLLLISAGLLMLSFDNKPVSGLLEIRSYMHSSPRLVLRNSTITAAAIIVIVAWAIRKPIDASQLCFNGKEIGSKRDEVSKGILLSLIDMEGSNYGDCKCQYTVAAIAGVCSLSSEKCIADRTFHSQNYEQNAKISLYLVSAWLLFALLQAHYMQKCALTASGIEFWSLECKKAKDLFLYYYMYIYTSLSSLLHLVAFSEHRSNHIALGLLGIGLLVFLCGLTYLNPPEDDQDMTQLLEASEGLLVEVEQGEWVEGSKALVDPYTETRGYHPPIRFKLM